MTAQAQDPEVTRVLARALLGITEAAEYLGVSERWLYDQVRDGQLPAMYIARSWKIRPEALDRFADSFMAKTAGDLRSRGEVRHAGGHRR
jgi:excisionase family DNA binding protein